MTQQKVLLVDECPSFYVNGIKYTRGHTRDVIELSKESDVRVREVTAQNEMALASMRMVRGNK